MAHDILKIGIILVLALTANAGNILLNAGGEHLPTIGYRCDTGAYANSGSKFKSGTKITVSGFWGSVYQSHRWVSTGDLEYKIPVPDGTYTIFLLWAETWAGSGLGVRQFKVQINGELQSQPGKFDGTLDVFKAAGGLFKPYFFNAGKKASKNGFLTITLGRIPGKNNPMLSGMAIWGTNADGKIGAEGVGSCASGSPTPTLTSTVSPSPSPVAVGTPAPVEGCGEASVTTGRNNNGNAFVMNVGGPAAPDIGFGTDNINYIEESDIGLTAKAPVPVIDNGKWGEPQQTQRYTKGPTLTYKIPVPAGTYHVGLLFTESFMNAAGKRTFDILINGDLKVKSFDVFKANGGKNKPGYKGFNGVKSLDGFIKLQFKKVVENPFVNGIHIKGTGAGTIAIGGPDTGPCKTKGSVSGTCPNQVINTEFRGKHFAHAVGGGPYVETDFSNNGLAKVNLDGSLSHSHFQEGDKNAKITKWDWTWKDPSNPSADKTTGIVSASGVKVSANFPLGVTEVSLVVTDNFCNAALEKTTVTVNSATIPGAYCYYYDFGDQNPSTVLLPVNAKLNPKPLKGLNVGDINFANTGSFGDFPFKANTFAVRCQFFLDVQTAGELQYKVIHSGPVKIYHAGELVGSSDSKAANQVTLTKKEKTATGLQEWQVLYLRPKETEGKLIFQFPDGQIIPPNTIRHDSSSTLPVIISVSPSKGQPEQLTKIFGTAFVNGVKVKFGDQDAVALEGTPGKIEVRAPTGFAPNTVVPVTVTTEAGVSNAFSFLYTATGAPPLKFKEDIVRNPSGTPYAIGLIAVVKYGPDGRLYCGAVNSKIYSLTLNKDLKVTQKCVKNVFEKWPRAVLGLGFDPSKNDLKLFFTTSTIEFKKKNLGDDGWQNGKVKTVTMASPTGCFNNDVADVVTGLPVSNHDHAIQAIEFLPNGKMLIGIGGFTNGGISIPGDAIGGFPSNALSGAIIECPSASVTNIKHSSIDPLEAKITQGKACKVYAAGFRNTFGMSYFTNNNLYATDNGPNKNTGLFSTNCVGGRKADKKILDKLFLVQPGKCHGHPNIHRGLNGFPDECMFENPKCVQPIISGLQSSTNGVMEYRSNIFGTEAKGNMFLSKFATGKNEGRVSRVILDESGIPASGGFTNEFYNKSGLSMVEGPRGEIIMSRVYREEIMVLKPDYTKPIATFFISVMPRRGPAAGGQTVLITGHNFGTSPSAKFGMKACTDVIVIDDDSFTCKTPAGTANIQMKVEVTGTTGVATGPGFDYWYF